MQFSRRQMMAMVAAAATLPAAALAQVKTSPRFGAFEGAEGPADGITLTAPEIAENGNTVPIEVEAAGAQAIAIYAMGNPVPEVAVFEFGPLAAEQRAQTRIRLAQTQDVVAVAQMQDGSFRRVAQEVKVTIGGCGG